MENPEEVLQALDEFQKLKPSEIPRELEDYLCWVAKTGDPIYQWSLVKSLFREKLLRVMNDFYESCPTLDLTPCPNVEQFNYEAMKRILLERLDSFSNAPFTVQRICELLTAPRKEYNRIDKFMRAIEKNILVVSTREPGPYGRHSENGNDNLVNGSVEDIEHHRQSTHEVDMENWVKDNTSFNPVTTMPMQVGEGEENELKDKIEDKIEPQSYVTSTTAEFIANVNPTIDHNQGAVVQNLTNDNIDPDVATAVAAAAIVSDVSDAIMNEDTNSQPSLELDSDDSSDSKKLQPTFENKELTLEIKAELLKSQESIENVDVSKQPIHSDYSENMKEADGNAADSINVENLDAVQPAASENIEKVVDEPEQSEKAETGVDVDVNNFTVTDTSNEESKPDEVTENVVTETTEAKDPEVAKEQSSFVADDAVDGSVKESIDESITATLVESVKPIIEEPAVDMTESIGIEEAAAAVSGSNVGVTIEETTEGKIQAAVKTIVPDPIPIIEEPKEVVEQLQEITDTITQLKQEETVKNGLAESPNQADMVVQGSGDEVLSKKDLSTASDSQTSDTMDVDHSEALSVQQQQDQPQAQPDEPMETAEAMNS